MASSSGLTTSRPLTSELVVVVVVVVIVGVAVGGAQGVGSGRDGVPPPAVCVGKRVTRREVAVWPNS